MSENIHNNIKQIVTAFDKFLDICDKPAWVRTASTEDVKTAFKLGSFVERTIEQFEATKSLEQFQDVLNECVDKTKTNKNRVSFYKNACDNLLKLIFKQTSVSDNTLDIAVRMYSALFPKDRLENCLSDLIITSSSLLAISDFVNNYCEVDVTEFKYRLLLNNLSKLDNNKLIDEVNSFLSIYKIDSSLNLIIGVLTIQDTTEAEINVLNIVLEKLLEKMLDRSILSKNFWLTLFKFTEMNNIVTVCVNFRDFLTSLCNFMVYTGSMMEKEEMFDFHVWKSDVNIALCPEITYYDLLHVVRNLCRKNCEMKNYILLRLNEAKEQTELVLWDDMIKDAI